MHAVARDAVNAYARIGTETGVIAADPHKLILMLFEGANLAVVDAKLHLQRKEVAAKGQAISKAIMIIDHGLKASLDTRVGGEIAHNLHALYEYMVNRLLFANLRNDAAALEEVGRLLAEVGGAWAAIGTTKIVAAAAPAMDGRPQMVRGHQEA